MVKPPNRSMNEPAVCKALSNMLARNPSVSPTATCTTMAPINDAVSRLALTWCDSWGATERARAAATPAFTWAGIIRLLKGGATTIHELARTMASRNAMISSGGKVTLIRSRWDSGRDQAGDHVEQLVGEADDLSQHPVARDHDHQGDGGELRYERQRHFLDLGHRLEQRDGQADGQARDQDRSRHLGRHQHHVQRDFDYVGISHEEAPGRVRRAARCR